MAAHLRHSFKDIADVAFQSVLELVMSMNVCMQARKAKQNAIKAIDASIPAKIELRFH